MIWPICAPETRPGPSGADRPAPRKRETTSNLPPGSNPAATRGAMPPVTRSARSALRRTMPDTDRGKNGRRLGRAPPALGIAASQPGPTIASTGHRMSAAARRLDPLGAEAASSASRRGATLARTCWRQRRVSCWVLRSPTVARPQAWRTALSIRPCRVAAPEGRERSRSPK
ncbi:MAG: hypothetical protein JWO25_2155 [Alphaproteobacteria bacterium]|nr:hypothetical protein [Alphaproteobacteria bacterium]